MCGALPSHLLRLEEVLSPRAEGEALQSPGTPTSCAQPGAAAGDGAAVGPSDSVFFARVPPTVPHDDLVALFSRFGTVVHLNLFRRWAAAKASKGCGTVQFRSAREAAAALEALNSVHSFDGVPNNEGPMVVEWKDPSRLSAMAEGQAPAAGGRSGAKSKHASRKAASSACHHASRLWWRQGGGPDAARQQQQREQREQQQEHAHHTPSHGGPAGAGRPAWLAGAAACCHHPYEAADGGSHVPYAACGGGGGGCSHPFAGQHPALEALDLGLLSPPASLAQGAPSCHSSEGLLSPLGMGGLGDPSSWGGLVPVHMLSIMTSTPPPSHLELPGGRLPPAQGPANAAAAAAAAAGLQACPPSAAVGCATPGLDPWQPASLMLDSRQDSSSLSFSSQLSGPPAHAGGACRPLLLLHGGCHQQQQQAPPLLVLGGDGWSPDACGGLATAAAPWCAAELNGGGCSSSAVSSTTAAHPPSSYSLFDSSELALGALLSAGPLGDAPAPPAAATAPAACGHVGFRGGDARGGAGGCDARRPRGRAAGPGPGPDLAPSRWLGSLSDTLPRLAPLAQQQHPLCAAAHANGLFAGLQAAGGCAAACGLDGGGGCCSAPGLAVLGGSPLHLPDFRQQQQQQQQRHETMHIPLSEAEAARMSGLAIHIAKVSGAQVGVTTHGAAGSQLQLQGAAAEISAACNMVRILMAP